ncbi:MAG: C40 family peptidase [Proteiniphilum sp.]|nr:C40 family peptidase [Proteiniphilum sp.]
MPARAHTESICYKVISLIIISLILLSCGAGRTTVARKKSGSATLQEEIIGYGRKYIGKPYRYAGRGPRSFDCSGYTAFVFKEFGYHLNPSSGGQDKQFPAVTRKENLQKGDLVFFEGRRKNGKVGHVGIVMETLSNGAFRFIHASTGDGVIITSSSEDYWASRYLRGGRILEENEGTTQ